MIALINKTAAVAGLALAALPFVALGFAHAAPAPVAITATGQQAGRVEAIHTLAITKFAQATAASR